MKIKELKELLSNYDEDCEIYIRNGNGALETNNLKIVQILYTNEQKSYLIDTTY